ncbi:MAG: glycosyltransferase family 2 protein [Methanobacterium sp.]
MKPTVSVIIATYNRAYLIGRAIKSILDQTFQDFELIIVDDGSSDNTKELITKYMQEDPRIKYIKNKRNLGLPKTRNEAIKVAQGKYIGLLDDDDEWLPNKLEKQVNKFQSTPKTVGLVYCGLIYISRNEKPSKTIIPKLKGNLFTDILKGNFFGSSTPLIKKECFEKSGFFDGNFSNGEDWDMWIRISKNYEIDYVPEALTLYYVHGNQMSANFNDTIEGFEKILKKHNEDINNYPSVYSTHLFRLGIFHCLNENFKCGQKYFTKSIKIKPQIKAYLNNFLLKIAPTTYKKILFFLIKRFTVTGLFI